jgi:putative drug exporter of the RND superfamily
VLATLPVVAFAEIGFAVAFGVLLDTLIVRSLLVPALVYELDDKVWWPIPVRRTPAGEATPPRQRSSGEPDRTTIRHEG